MKKFFKEFIIILLLLLLYILICAFSYSNAVCENISNNIFRLHVIANSNSEEDQSLKYKVRDAVLQYMNSILTNNITKTEAMQCVEENLPAIQNIAKETIISEGYNYDVSIEIGNFYFPTKSYGDITFPPAYYDALRIKIGEATGENWWCVMFPALCFVDPHNGIVADESKQYLEEVLPKEEFELISEHNINSNIKFKFVELLQNVSNNGIFI